MSKREKIKDFLTNDDALKLLRTIDALNPPSLPTNRLCTIREVSEAMGLGLKATWEMIDAAASCDLVSFYGGILSKKRVDLTELGERVCECTTSNEIRGVLNAIQL